MGWGIPLYPGDVGGNIMNWLKFHMKHSILLSMVLCLATFMLVSGLMGQDDAKTRKAMPPTLIELCGNGETAQALCFGKAPYLIDEILFKGPSGVKIKLTRSRGYFPGDSWDFVHIGGHSVFTQWGSPIFYEQNLPVPVIYVINGVYIAGLGDGGSQEHNLEIALNKEFDKLPVNFQQGLREMYLFCDKATIGVATSIGPLRQVFGKLETYKVQEFFSIDPIYVKMFQEEFYGN
jgi:hypothetical protein